MTAKAGPSNKPKPPQAMIPFQEAEAEAILPSDLFSEPLPEAHVLPQYEYEDAAMHAEHPPEAVCDEDGDEYENEKVNDEEES